MHQNGCITPILHNNIRKVGSFRNRQVASSTLDLPITKRPNLAYVVGKCRCDGSVLVHFRRFRKASVQQFVQQPRGDVSRDYLASLRRSRTASTRIKMRRVPRSACSALRTRTCGYQSTSEPRPQRKKPSSLPPRTRRPVHGHSFQRNRFVGAAAQETCNVLGGEFFQSQLFVLGDVDEFTEQDQCRLRVSPIMTYLTYLQGLMQ